MIILSAGYPIDEVLWLGSSICWNALVAVSLVAFFSEIVSAGVAVLLCSKGHSSWAFFNLETAYGVNCYVCFFQTSKVFNTGISRSFPLPLVLRRHNTTVVA